MELLQPLAERLDLLLRFLVHGDDEGIRDFVVGLSSGLSK